MSRYQIPTIDPALEAWVGWDDPLQTYFGQVYDRRLPEDDWIVLWVGTDPGELRRVTDLRRALRKYAPLDLPVARRLAVDRAVGAAEDRRRAAGYMDAAKKALT